ncbi:PTS sugar transporter subunit IIA [Paraburkholderia kururiensis]|uniref:PTS sugar transporter subunit IIA n=1 Tax=Paraburkholderia kururiensis TaxID=984307 RepID=A0ABZ0WQ58_9BURK|nr:PTS sugar transporter subunit IIA [Paraburkholderia kururiensis]WQD79507.1 PTS sugar transporter subunit IIA [Paraburkholderia kururiensis]
MTHPLSSLRTLGALLKIRKSRTGSADAASRSNPTPSESTPLTTQDARRVVSTSRYVMMHVTVDPQHATPLRKALIRDCCDQPWTLRLTSLHATGRVRLSLYLPKSAVSGAMLRVAHLAPTAEIGRLLEIPAAPTDAWQDLVHGDARARAEPVAESSGREFAQAGATLARLLSPARVLLDLDIADRETLFARLGELAEHKAGLPADTVTAALAAREAMGSTGLGQGVAVPHGQVKGLREAVALYARLATPIAFDAPDAKPVRDVVMLLVPEWATSTHLHLLADVAQRFCDQRFRAQLHACADPTAVCRLFAGAYEQRSGTKPASTSPQTETNERGSADASAQRDAAVLGSPVVVPLPPNRRGSDSNSGDRSDA